MMFVEALSRRAELLKYAGGYIPKKGLFRVVSAGNPSGREEVLEYARGCTTDKGRFL